MPTRYPPYPTGQTTAWPSATTTTTTAVDATHIPYTYYINGDPVDAVTARQLYEEAVRIQQLNEDVFNTWSVIWNPSVADGVKNVDLDEIDGNDSKELDEYLSEFNISEE